jgi:pimeloyl-ACP methyl ester carboxylesterase
MPSHVLETPEVDLAYDVERPLPTADGRPPLLLIGQPMDAGGFRALAARFPDRTVVTYDPRGLGRSVRKDGRVDHTPETQAADLHALVGHLGVGPVDLFASSGGAVTALDLVAAHPGDVTTLPTADDGSRDDPLLSDRSWAVSSYRPDVEALAAASTRVVIAVGEESAGTLTARTAEATAALLGGRATVFPSHHGGFLDGEFGYAGKPDEFAATLREVLGR